MSIGVNNNLATTNNWLRQIWQASEGRRHTNPSFNSVVEILHGTSDELVKNKVHFKIDGKNEFQAGLRRAHEIACKTSLWGNETSLYAGKDFLDLWHTGMKENYMFMVLGSLIARNLESPSITYFTNDFQSEDNLRDAINDYEKKSTRFWLQRVWQSRHKYIGPETNTHLKWEETSTVIQDAVKETLGERHARTTTSNDLRKIMEAIHKKMIGNNLWNGEHNVPYSLVNWGPRGNFYTTSMTDNYLIMALVGLLPKTEYDVKTIAEEIGSS